MKPEPNKVKEIGMKKKTISRTLLQRTHLHLVLPKSLISEQTLIKTSQGILQSHQSKSSLTDSFILLVFDPEFGQICCFTKKWGNIYISSNIRPSCNEGKEKRFSSFFLFNGSADFAILQLSCCKKNGFWNITLIERYYPFLSDPFLPIVNSAWFLE